MIRRTVAMIMFLAAIGGGAKLAWDASRPVQLAHPVFVEIAPGSATQGIAAKLESAGLLRSRWPFLAWHYLRLTRAKLKAGEYYFEGRVDFRTVHSKLARGDIYYHTVVIP